MLKKVKILITLVDIFPTSRQQVVTVATLVPAICHYHTLESRYLVLGTASPLQHSYRGRGGMQLPSVHYVQYYRVAWLGWVGVCNQYCLCANSSWCVQKV